jgi:phosphoglycolate phosphatase
MKAILFDLDGTLLDTLTDLANAANRILSRAGLPVHPTSAYRQFIGDGSRMLISRALPQSHQNPEKIDEYLARFKAEYGRSWNVDTRPYPGILDLLEDMDRRRIPRAVVTNKPHPFAEQCVHHFFPDTPFHVIRGQKAGFPLKPDPSPALEVAAELNVSPEECALIGDSDVDMRTALAAGMLPLGAAWGFRPVAELRQAGAARIAEHPNDVMTWLDGQS